MFEVIHYDPSHEDLLEEIFQLPDLPERNQTKEGIHYDRLMEDGVLLLIRYKGEIRGMECCPFQKENVYWAKFPWRVVHHKMPYFPRYLYEQKIYDEIAKRKIMHIASFWNVSSDYHRRINKQMAYTQKHQNLHQDKLSDASLMYLPYWKVYDKQVLEFDTWSIPVYCNLVDGNWFLNREEKEIDENFKIHFEPHTIH